MKKKDAVVGLRVAEKLTQYYEDEEVWPGTIVEGNGGPGHVMVEWDQPEYQKKAGIKPIPTQVSLKNLLPFKEAKAHFSELEREYKVYEKQVAAKLKQAGKLIREADKLALKAGADSLHEMYNATSPLFDAMENAGWHTSSLGC